MSTGDQALPKRLRIKAEWELLHLADGSLVFANLYGRYLRVSQPSELVRALFRLLDGQLSTEELFASAFGRPLSGSERASLRAALGDLLEAGILEDQPSLARPSWVDDDLFERFALEISYFSRFATPEADEYALFRRLRESTVLVLGAGGNGSYCAMQLAAAGIGALVLVDADVVESSNLVRQIFYEESDCGVVRKVDSLARRIRAFTRFTEVETVASFVRDEADALRLLDGRRVDFVLLCADAPRILLNRAVDRACVSRRVPYLNAFGGFIGPIYVPGSSPCFHCVENTLLRRNAAGYWDLMVEALQQQPSPRYPSFVAGPVHAALIQVLECVGYLTGAWPLRTANKVLKKDTITVTGEEVVPIDPSCDVCGPFQDAKAVA